MEAFSRTPDSLTEVWDLCWKLLGRGVADPKDPLRTMTLVTWGDPFPQARSVILREISREQQLLICHSDLRSGKIQSIQGHPEISWHAWHPKKRMQLRIRAFASLHQADDFARNQWEQVPLASRINYSATLPPGTKIEQPRLGFEAYKEYGKVQALESEAWRDNFVAIRSQVYQIEWLWLRREGHLRAEVWQKDGKVQGRWLVP